MSEIRVISTSGSVPTVNQLALGDLALNTFDGKLYLKKFAENAQTIIEIGGGAGSTTNTGSLLTNATFSNPNLTFTRGNGSTFNINLISLVPTSASYAVSASFARSASYAATASSADTFIVRNQLTASGLNYPVADNGEFSFIQTDGLGNLSLQYVNTLYETIYNGEATSLAKGTPVYVSGSIGANSIVYRADAGNPSKMPVIYIAADNIASGTTGRGIALGLITGVDTTGYPAGTEIYVAVGGGWTSVRPTGSATIQVLGIVTKEGSGGQGVVLNPGPANLPNLPSGSFWVGNSGSFPVAIPTASLSVATASFATSASFATTSLTASFVRPLTQSVFVSGSIITSGSSTFTEVVNSPRLQSLTNVNTYISLAGGGGAFIDFRANNSPIARMSSGGMFIGSDTTPSSRLQVRGSGTTSATTALRVENANASASLSVNDAGNVLIGTTTDAGYKLDVNGTVRFGDLASTYYATLANGGSDGGIFRVGGANYGYAQLVSYALTLNGGHSISGTGGTAQFSLTSQVAPPAAQSNAAIKFVADNSGSGGGTWAAYTTALAFNFLKKETSGTYTSILAMNGRTNFVGIGIITPSASLQVATSVIASSALARGVFFNNPLVASANNDVLVGLDIAPTFTNGAFTGVNNVALRTQTGSVLFQGNTSVVVTGSLQVTSGITGSFSGSGIIENSLTASFVNPLTQSVSIRGSGTTSATTALRVENANASASLVVNDTGSVLIGTATDAGFKLDVNGSIRSTSDTYLATNSSNNVGLGVTSASSKLHVNGNILVVPSSSITSAHSGLLIGFNRYSSTQVGYWGASDGAISNSDGNLYIAPRNINAGNGSYIALGQRDSSSAGDKGTITIQAGTYNVNAQVGDIFLRYGAGQTVKLAGNTGNFLIGTTTDSSFKLDVSGSGRFTNGLTITGSLTVVTGSSIELQVTNTGVKIGNNISDIHPVTGSLIVSGSITGSLFGTASQAVSASYAPSSPAFPYTGSAEISGSLVLSGSAIITGGVINSTSTGTTSGTDALIIKNSNPDTLFKIKDDGEININTTKYSANGVLTNNSGVIAETVGYNGIVVIVGNPPGSQNLQFTNGILTAVF